MRLHVCDFMTDHRRQLVLVLGDLEQAGVDADLAARQGEGVGAVVAEHHDFPAATHLAGDRVCDALHIVVGLPVRFNRCLALDIVEGLQAHLVHLAFGHQHQLRAPRWRGGAGDQQCQQADEKSQTQVHIVLHESGY